MTPHQDRAPSGKPPAPRRIRNIPGSDHNTTAEPSAQPPGPLPGQELLLRRWMFMWVILGGTIVAITAVFLLLIGNSLAGINANLTSTDGAVTDMAGNTTTLPGQIREVNEALTEIDHAMLDVPGHSIQIRDHLADVMTSLRAIDTSLQPRHPNCRTPSATSP